MFNRIKSQIQEMINTGEFGSRADAARQIGIPRTTLIDFMDANHEPSIGTINKLSSWYLQK